MWEISAYVGFVKKKLVTMHGHMNVKEVIGYSAMMFIGCNNRDVQVIAYAKPQFLQSDIVYVLVVCSWTKVKQMLSPSYRFTIRYKSRITIHGIPNYGIYLTRKYRNPYISLPCYWKKMEPRQSVKNFGNANVHHLGHKTSLLKSI